MGSCIDDSNGLVYSVIAKQASNPTDFHVQQVNVTSGTSVTLASFNTKYNPEYFSVDCDYVWHLLIVGFHWAKPYKSYVYTLDPVTGNFTEVADTTSYEIDFNYYYRTYDSQQHTMVMLGRETIVINIATGKPRFYTGTYNDYGNWQFAFPVITTSGSGQVLGFNLTIALEYPYDEAYDCIAWWDYVNGQYILPGPVLPSETGHLNALSIGWYYNGYYKIVSGPYDGTAPSYIDSYSTYDGSRTSSSAMPAGFTLYDFTFIHPWHY
ncbi:hypothetical protein Pelo_4644 [Pelomyxa schiedti]|nr:hypothetical protein Pelo_4644 [Pelomyxa schiedti]